MAFSATHPIQHKRLIRKLLAFGKVGYYLDDTNFAKYEEEIVGEIKEWISEEHAAVNVGKYVFDCLSDVAYRLSQDTLSEICCLFIDKHFSRWYLDMFKFMSKRINLNEMSSESAGNLIAHIISILRDKKEGEQVKYRPSFLSVLREQSKTLTEDLDKQISECLPDFYNFSYKLETTENKIEDSPIFIEKLIKQIHQNNTTQGKSGKYFGHATRNIAAITSILQSSDFNYSVNLMDKLIFTVTETLLESKEDISIKLDAVLLLCCIVIKYPQDYSRNQELYKSVANRENEIYIASDSILFSNISSLALRIGLKLLFLLIGSDVHTDMIELLPLISKDTTTAIKVTSFIADYLEINENLMLERTIDTILLHNTFEWLQMDSIPD